jgi:hypothetical protein
MEEWRDSEASSASRKRPGMIYVRERRADSIWVTEDWFLVMNVPYIESHFGGSARRFGIPCRAVAGLRVSMI